MFSLLSKICRLSKRTIWAVRPSRDFFTFLFFLVLSGIFWLSSTLNEYYDREVIIPVAVSNAPKDVVLTSNSEDTIRVMVRDKGYTILAYSYGSRSRMVDIDFGAYIRTDGKAVVSSSELHKLVKRQLSASSSIVSLKPDKLEYGFIKGVPKTVPVRVEGEIIPAENYYLAHTQVTPQMVTVYSGRSMLDSIKFVQTNDVQMRNFTDTVEIEVGLKPISGARISPQKVKVKFFPDVLTEETIEVPITAINVPEGLQLRMFPTRVKLHFNVGMSQFRNVSANQFVVVADFNAIEKDSEHCPIKVVRMPAGVSKVSPEISQIDYLIEN